MLAPDSDGIGPRFGPVLACGSVNLVRVFFSISLEEEVLFQKLDASEGVV